MSGLINNPEPYQIVYTVFFLSFGILFLLFGLRLFKPVTIAGGALAFGFLAYFILEKASENGEKFGENKNAIYIGGIAGVSFLGALLCHFLWKIGVALLAFMAGVGVGELIMLFFPDLAKSIDSTWGRWILDGGIGLLFAMILVAAFLEKFLIAFCSSLVGSVSIALGVDLIGGYGLADEMKKHLLGANRDAILNLIQYSTPMKIALGAICGGTIVGILIQYSITGKESQGYSKDRKEKNKYRDFESF